VYASASSSFALQQGIDQVVELLAVVGQGSLGLLGAVIEQSSDLFVNEFERALGGPGSQSADRGGRHSHSHDAIHALAAARDQLEAIDAGDAYRLAGAIDDIVDYTEEAGDSLVLYRIEAPMEQAIRLADVLVLATAQVSTALACFSKQESCDEQLSEIHRLENEGDRLLRGGLASLFEAGIDPMVVIRWKDVFEGLEDAIDACQKVAHVLEGAALSRPYRH
jgi:hypothetical protein